MLPGKPAGATNRAAIRTQIDENLRRVYDEVLTEDVPDRFLDLLARLPGAAQFAEKTEK
ncbi:hypothetical protein HOY34_01785 [Xinfangfangia sp. D13-10-4-6]|uniref:NepR family anti-sigma factor n=1 Tax=Pseudogemmobacter hezensis TaxID=2737662 RepID=UPI0015553557|nr:NepR family anti-sigma factor [Pseudogemmobacter hezensis]NPD13929.1 hypothetical protein [Pseudogemmobacter hezensis]